MSEWIRVKDRLPEVGVRVWLAMSNGMTGEGYLRDLKIDSRSRSYWKFRGYNCKVPDYWQPLPAPPEASND